MSYRALIVSIVFASSSALVLSSIETTSASRTVHRTVAWEAELSDEIVPPFSADSDSRASGNAKIHVVPGDGQLVHDVTLEAADTYRFWGRCLWSNGCRDSFLVTVNDEHSFVLGDDPTYDAWHWVPGPMLDLDAGLNRIVVRGVGRNNVYVDRFALTTAPSLEELESSLGRTGSRRTEIRFDEDFWNYEKRLQSGAWMPVDGEWSLGEGRLKSLQPRGTGTSLITAGSSGWTSYSLSASIRYRRLGSVGLAFGYRTKLDHDLALLTASEEGTALEVIRVRGGEQRKIGHVKLPAPPGRWFRLTVETRGRQIRVKKDEKIVLRESVDEASRGRIGLVAQGDCGGSFDDIRVRSIDAFSAASFVWKGSKRVAAARHGFVHADELRRWSRVDPGWRLSRHTLTYDPSDRNVDGDEATMIHRQRLSEDHLGRIRVGIEPGASFSLLVVPAETNTDDALALQVTRAAETLIVSTFAGATCLETRELGADTPQVAVECVGAPGHEQFYVNGIMLGELERPWAGPTQIGVRARGGSIALADFVLECVPLFYYYSWDAPIGWMWKRGQPRMGHNSLWGRSQDGDALVWQRAPFAAETLSIDLIARIRRAMNRKMGGTGFMDLVFANRGTDSVNGYRLRINPVGENPLVDITDLEFKLWGPGLQEHVATVPIKDTKQPELVFMRVQVEKTAQTISVACENRVVLEVEHDARATGDRLGLVFSSTGLSDAPVALREIAIFE